jgi:hypothetical protein
MEHWSLSRYNQCTALLTLYHWRALLACRDHLVVSVLVIPSRESHLVALAPAPLSIQPAASGSRRGSGGWRPARSFVRRETGLDSLRLLSELLFGRPFARDRHKEARGVGAACLQVGQRAQLT